MIQTIDEILETGNGALEYRLEIEGFRYNFVTNEALTGVSGSVVRLPGLLREGLATKYEAQLMDRRLNAGGMSFNIVDNMAPLRAYDPASGSQTNESHAITEALSIQWNRQTFLRSDLSAASTTVDVQSTDDWNNGDVIHIGTEAIYIGLVSHANRQFLGCTRGYHGTIPQSHPISDASGVSGLIYVTDAPLMLERRRCYLYVYGDGDDFSGPGLLIWRGIITSGKELVNATTWKLTARAITEILREKFGGFGEGSIRGIYHPTGFAFGLHVRLQPDSSISVSNVPDDTFDVSVDGFHESRELFAEEVSNQLRAGSAAWDSQVWAEIDDQDRLAIMFATGPNNKAIVVRNTLMGLVKTATGRFDHARVLADFERFETIGACYEIEGDGSTSETTTAPADVISNTTANRTYKIVPTAVDGDTAYPQRVSGLYPNWLEQRSVRGPIYYPPNRLFVDFGVIADATNTLLLTADEGDIARREMWITVTGNDSNSGSIDVSVINELGAVLITGDSHEMRTGIGLTQEGSIVDALGEYVRIAANNKTLMPFLTSNDIDIDDMRLELSSSGLGPFVTARQFALFDASLRLEEYLAEEFKVAGMIPTINPENQKITFKRLRFGSINEETTAVFDSSNMLTDERFPGYIESKESLHNVGLLKTGYSFKDDEHFGRPYKSIFASSAGAYGASFFEIAPKSRESTMIDQHEMETILIRPISIFGLPYAHVSFEAPFILEAVNLRPASIIRITNLQLPNTMEGTRGLTNHTGYVMDVRHNLADGRVKIEALVSLVTLSGYTPTARIDSGILSSNTWSFLVLKSEQRYSAPGTYDYESFNIGDAFRVETFNSWSTTAAEGVITNTADVASTWQRFFVSFSQSPPGALTGTSFIDARMRYPAYTGSLMTSEQQTWAFIATSSLRPDPPIRTFGA